METRNSDVCPIVGALLDFIPINRLPKTIEIIKHVLWLDNKLKNEKSVPLNEIRRNSIDIVAHLVTNIWIKASIPAISHQRIVKIINKLLNKRRDTIKNKRQSTTKFDDKVISLNKEWDSLFDVALCKCEFFYSCKCVLDSKVN